MSKYVEYLRIKAASATQITELANDCHNPPGEGGGRFCEKSKGGAIRTPGVRLSTSVPTFKRNNPYKAGDERRMGLELVTDAVVNKLIGHQSDVPGFKDLSRRRGRKALEIIIDRQSEHIEDVFATAMEISEMTVKAHADWYPYINDWSHDLAAELGYPPEAIMGALAALSPSADWANNVAWGKYVSEMVQNKNIKVTKKWIAAEHLAAVAAWEVKQRIAAAKGTEFTLPKPQPEDHMNLVGKRVASLSDAEAAIAIRGSHEACGKCVHQLGGHAGFGNPKNIATPQSEPNFEKAISILRNPTTQNIDAKLGMNHKVRSFYANIRDPLDAKFHEVTVDSHLLGIANGIPLASAHPLVKRIYDGPKTNATGLVGTYPLVVEATRRATQRINERYGTNFTPNQVQSITWEAHRALYPSDKRSGALVKKIGTYRQQYRSGKISKNEMLARIENARLGVGGPTLEKIREQFLDELGKGS